MAWERVRRANSQPSEPTSFITLRRAAIAFNAHFIRANDLERATRVTILADTEARRLGFEFHNNATDFDSLSLTQDGGQRNATSPARRGASRVVQTSYLMRQPWLRKALERRSNLRFVPHREGRIWTIDIGPTFESDASSTADVPSDVTGIYRYVNGDEVVYIGRGAIRDRMKDQARQDWAYTRVQFSVLNDSDAESLWEERLLKEHEQKWGTLPRYNRVRGFTRRQGNG